MADLSEYRVFETEEFLKRLEALPRQTSLRIRRKLEGHLYPLIRHNPYSGPNIKKLRGYSPDTWRYRIGDFRIFYGVDKDRRVVEMLTVNLRRDAYR